MKMTNITRICCILILLAGWVVVGKAVAADEAAVVDTQKVLQEMPVLTGETWQTMQPDSKIAFIWGVGHVVTIEEHVIQRHPELLRKDFVAKLGDGLRGVPMSSIIEQVDGYYRQNPDDLDLPVMRVIWSEVVRPRLKAGIADQPFREQ
ncbi:MAG TPA: hypothetical protein DCZ75_10250 [Geobacter sp.]|nr:hypothetical protein [Geobacter sp.]